MRNLVLVVILFFVTTICSAQVELEGNKEGIYRIKEDDQEWASSKVTAEYRAVKYIDKFPQVINNPGTPILVNQSEKFLKLKPIFKKLVEVKECFIVYNSQTKNIDYISTTPVKKEETSYLILFSIASISLMLILNILFKKRDENASALAFASAFASALAFAFASASALALAFASAKDKGYKVVSIIFYILMAAHIVLLFI